MTPNRMTLIRSRINQLEPVSDEAIEYALEVITTLIASLEAAGDFYDVVTVAARAERVALLDMSYSRKLLTSATQGQLL